MFSEKRPTADNRAGPHVQKRCAPESLREWVTLSECERVYVCVGVWAWLSRSSSASLQSAKVGQPNLSQGGAEELLLCFLLTVEVITSLVMQMSIPLFKLSAMQGSCQHRHMKKKKIEKRRRRKKKPPSTIPFPFFSRLSFLNQISGTWQHKHQALMWKTTPLHQKTCQSQSLFLSLSCSILWNNHALYRSVIAHFCMQRGSFQAVLPV